MNSKDWHSYKLKDLCTKIGSGSTPRGGSGVYLESGTTFIRSQNIYNNYFEYNGLVFIDDDASHKLRSVEVERDDVLLNITGDSVARCTIVPKKLLPARVNQHVCILRADKSKLDPFYLQYFFVNPRMQQEMLSLAYSGGTRAALTKAMIENFNITLPNIKEQKEISKILSALDSKIEINNKINKNLEEMAQAIFKQWFIDFEFSCIPENYKFSGAGKPCNLESAGKPHDFDKVCTYKRVGGLPIPDGDSWFVYVLLCEDGSFYKGITKDLYRRFYEHYTGIGAEWTKTHKPVKVIHYEKFSTQEEARKREEELKSGFGREWIKREYKKYIEGSPAHQTRLVPAGEMVESELGMIPKGWSVTELNSIGNLTMGLSPKSSSYNTNQEGYPLLNGAADFNGGLITPTKYTTQETRLCNKGDLVFCIRATIGNITFADKKYCLGRGVASIESKDQIYKGLIYMNLDKSIEKLKAQATGSVILGLSKPDINNMKIVLPHIELIKQYSKCFNDIYELKKVNELENQRIQELRDTLLPKLMSGEIRVNID